MSKCRSQGTTRGQWFRGFEKLLKDYVQGPFFLSLFLVGPLSLLLQSKWPRQQPLDGAWLLFGVSFSPKLQILQAQKRSSSPSAALWQQESTQFCTSQMLVQQGLPAVSASCTSGSSSPWTHWMNSWSKTQLLASSPTKFPQSTGEMRKWLRGSLSPLHKPDRCYGLLAYAVALCCVVPCYSIPAAAGSCSPPFFCLSSLERSHRNRE